MAQIPADVFVIVPAFNEATVIASVIDDLKRHAQSIVVVDDCSHDATAENARAAGAVVLVHALNRGQGAAIQTGLDYALRRGARAIVTFDADGQHSADDLPVLLDRLADGNDFVLGSRFLNAGDSNVPPLRKLMLKMAILFTRITSRLDVTDAHNGLRAFSRRGAQAIQIQLDRMAHASEIMDQIRASGLPYAEVPVRVRYTDYTRRKGQRGVHAIRVAFDYLLGRWVR